MAIYSSLCNTSFTEEGNETQKLSYPITATEWDSTPNLNQSCGLLFYFHAESQEMRAYPTGDCTQSA